MSIQLTSIEPQLFITDMQRTRGFYEQKLGFKLTFVYGDPPFYGQLHRDEARLNLRVVSEPVFSGDVREREGLLSATITIATKSEVEHLEKEYRETDVTFHQALKREPWGATTFIIRDPDGNLLLFAGPGD